MASLDAVEHRTSEARGLLGGEARDQLRLLLIAVDRTNRAENNSRHSTKRARLTQLYEHPVDSISLLAGVFEKQDSSVEARLVRRANHGDNHRQASANHLTLRTARMQRLARLELEAVDLAVKQPLQMFEGARTQALGKIHRNHRPMKGHHPGKIHQRIEQKCCVRKADEDFRRGGHRLEVENRQQPPASVAATRGKNRLDLGVGEVSLELARAIAIVAGQDSRTRQHALRDLHAKAYRSKHVDAALEMSPFDRRG